MCARRMQNRMGLFSTATKLFVWRLRLAKSARSTATPVLKLGGQYVNSVDQYKYLGIILDVCSNRGAKHEMGIKYYKWGAGTTAPRWRRPCGVAVLFALLALNVIQTVLLQLKIIPCDSLFAWHSSSILCNQRTLGQNTQISSANIKWFNKTSPI